MKILLAGFDSTEEIDVETGYFSRTRSGEYFVKDSKSWICI